MPDASGERARLARRARWCRGQGNRVDRRRSQGRGRGPVSSDRTSSGREAARSILLTTTIGRRSHRERPLEHGPRLRHRPFDRIDEQKAAVGHVQHPLDLAAEIGVAGGVDDVDLDAAVGDRGVFGEDRDPALPLQIVGVHDQLAGGIGVAEDVRLLEQPVDQRRFAVVDVRDDRDVAEVLLPGCRRSL